MEATRRKAGRPKKIEANEELKYDSASKSDDSSDASTEIIKALTIQLAALAKKMSEIENRVDQLESDQNDVLAPAIKSLGDQAVKANQLIDAAHARCQTLHNDLSELEDAFQTKMINEMPIDKPKQDKPKQAIENDLLASIRNIKF